MSTSFPPIAESNPHPKLCSETKEEEVRNVFVTQLEDSSPKKDERVSHRSSETKTPIRVSEAGLKTLKNSQVVLKKAELDKVDIELAVKKQEYKICLEALSQRRSELEAKQQQDKEKRMTFETFVSENEVKRCAALKKCEATREQNTLKQREIEDLAEQLKQLRNRKQLLIKKMTKFQIYEDYLMKTLDYLPIYQDSNCESSVMPIIWHHETLSLTHQELLQRLEQREVNFGQSQRQLKSMSLEHSIRKLMANKEVTELQGELEILRERNKQSEVKMMTEYRMCRQTLEETGRLLMAVKNLAEQCHLPAYGSLESMSVLKMMDMVKEFILDRLDTERRARRLMESSSTARSASALTDRRTKSIKERK